MRGTTFLKAWEKRIVAEREAIEVTARCAHCEWHQDGTVAETREAHLNHRLKAHPEIQPAARRKRVRPFGQLQTQKSLDDNIQNARKQGAGGWESQ